MLRHTLLHFVRGFAIGSADIVPGVSGGTIALVLGIYERLIASLRAGSKALTRLLRRDVGSFRSWLATVEWAFIVPLGIGILVAVLSLARLISDQLHAQPELMSAIFLGLVAGSVVVAWRLIHEPSAQHALIIALVGIITFVLLGVRGGTGQESVGQFAEPALWAYFMAVFMLGAIVGLALFSQLLHVALQRAHDLVLAGLIGLMAGSIRVLWPWPNGVDSTELGVPAGEWGVAIGLALVAFVLIVVVARYAQGLEAADEHPDVEPHDRATSAAGDEAAEATT